MQKIFILLFFFLLVSCDKRNIALTGLSESHQVSKVIIKNHHMTILGKNLDRVESIAIKDNSSFFEKFIIISRSSDKLVLGGLRNISFLVGKTFSLLISDANASSAYTISFDLNLNSVLTAHIADGAITSAKLSDMGASDGDVLIYNAGTSLWEARPFSGLSYRGTWNASTNFPMLSDGGSSSFPSPGDYYVVSVSGATSVDSESSWLSGDWIIFNGVNWDRIVNTSTVSSFAGRQGAITPQVGDYSINDLSQVDVTGAVVGSVLKFDGANWAVGVDNDTGVSANSIDSTSIQDGGVTNQDLAGSIDQSKISNLTTDLSSKLSLSGGTMTGNISFNSTQTFDGVDLSLLNSQVTSNTSALASKVDQSTTINGQALSSNINLTTTQVLEGTNLYFSATRAQAAVVLNSAAGVETNQSASVNAMKNYVAAQISASGDLKSDGSVPMTSTLNLSGNFIDNIGGLRLSDSDTNYVEIAAPSDIITNFTLTLPASSGAPNQILETDGNGVLSWVNKASGTGDFMADGSVSMTGDFNLGSQKILNGSAISLKGKLDTNLTGTVATNGTVNVIGTGTSFTSELSIGDAIVIAGEIFTVASIADNSNLTLDSAHSQTLSGEIASKDSTILSLSNGDDSSLFSVVGNGNIGVGISNPNASLHLVDNQPGILIEATGAANPYIQFQSPNYGNDNYFFLDEAGAGAMVFRNNGNNAMVINAAGDIGMGAGATSPVSKLHVDGVVTATSFTGDGSALTGVNATSISAGTDISLAQGATRSVAIERSITGAGDNLTVASGSAQLGSTNTDGGNLVLSSGVSTGTGSSKIEFKTSNSGVSGSADNSLATAMTILGNGNVGIGDINPTEKLSIEGDVKLTQVIPEIKFRSPSNNNRYYIGANISDSSDGGIHIGEGDDVASGTARFVINGDGDVGIGTTTPESLLHVNGIGIMRHLWLDNISAPNGKQSWGQVISSSNGQFNLGYRNDDAAGSGSLNAVPFVVRHGAPSYTLYLQESGNIGVGTNTPSSALHVSSDNGSMVLEDSNNSKNQSSFTSFVSGIDSSGSEAWWVGDGTSSGQSILLYSGSANYSVGMGNPAGNITLDPLGNVGIGTTSPGAKLELSGKMKLTNGFSSTNAAITYSDNSDYLFLGPQSGSSANGAAISIAGSTNNETSGGSGSISFMTSSASPAAVISSNGNIGVGTANPVAPITVFHTGDASGVNIARAPTAAAIGFNRYGTSNNRLNSSNTAFQFSHVDYNTDSILDFGLEHYNNSGVHHRNSLFIDGSTGNVGIGTTTPSNELELNVEQDSRTSFEVKNISSSGNSEATLFVRNSNLAGGSGALTLTGINYTTISGWQNRLILNTDSNVSGGIHIRPAVGGLQVSANGLNNPNFVVASDGKVGIGVLAPTEVLDVSGCIKHSGGTIGSSCASDKRLKTKIKNIEFSTKDLDIFLGLVPRTYVYKKNKDSLYYGFIAQEVETLSKSLLGPSKKIDRQFFKTVNYEKIKWLHFMASQNNVKSIKNLEDRVSKLEKDNEELRKIIFELIEKRNH